MNERYLIDITNNNWKDCILADYIIVKNYYKKKDSWEKSSEHMV